MKLKNKVVIVTGGGYGIGRVIALRFAAEGARVCIAARSKDKIEDTARQIKAQGGQVLAIPVDISREEDVESMVAQTVDHFDALDILVNNAAAEGPTDPRNGRQGLAAGGGRQPQRSFLLHEACPQNDDTAKNREHH